MLRDIHLTFGGHPLLEGAELLVAEGERICVVGRNGSGKSTLLKIAAGMIDPDDGEVFVQPGATVRYLPQEPDFSGFTSVLAYVEAGLAPGDDPFRAQYLLNELGLSGGEASERLSGGEARRAALARVLAPQPNILLLDEPTNHLDLPAIEWLEGELKSTRSALVLISHDRRFLEQLSQATLWVDRGTVRRLDKGFEHFEAWRDEVLESEATDRHTSSTASWPWRPTGCAMASPPGASATWDGCGRSTTCASSVASSARRRAASGWRRPKPNSRARSSPKPRGSPSPSANSPW